jgi:hypothetical protein
MNWAYARTVEGFIHILGIDHYEHSTCAEDAYDPSRVVEIAWRYLRVSARDLGILHLLPAVIPFLLQWRMSVRERGWMLGLSVVHFCLSFLLSDILNHRLDTYGMSIGEVFFAPSHVILAIWEGYGLCLLGTVLARKRAI